jgi:hypothetical protein
MLTPSVRGRQFVDTQSLTVQLQTEEYRSRPIPGLGKRAKIGECFVRVTDLPAELKHFMEVNPRTPKPARDGRLAGSVVAGIRETLTESPEQMAIKSIGILRVGR